MSSRVSPRSTSHYGGYGGSYGGYGAYGGCGYDEPTRIQRLGQCCRSCTASLMSHFGLVTLVMFYCVLGAFLFEYLEAPNEGAKRLEVMYRRGNVSVDLWRITNRSRVLEQRQWKTDALHVLKKFEDQVVRAVRKEGYDGNDHGEPPQWSFTGSLLYSIIVITTIGYGNVAPKTPQGRVVTIFYAIAGIPLMLLCLSNLGDTMAHSFKFSYKYMCCAMVHKERRPRRQRSRSRRAYMRSFAMAGNSSGGNHISAPESGLSSGSTGVRGVFTSNLNAQASSLPATPTLQQRHHAYKRSASVPRARATPALRADAWNSQIFVNRYAKEDDSQRPLENVTATGTKPTVVHRTSRSEPLIFDLGGYETESESSEEEYQRRHDEEAVPLWMCCGIVILYILGGAWLFKYYEDWDFLEGSYFCFVTLTTIGFGDVVPGQTINEKETQSSRLASCAIYLLFGMALIAMSFNLVQEEVKKKVRNIGKRVGIVSDDDDD
ncbi:potassium channel subfamily K member 10-like [Tropilaelaps mercedesae]|uniref:Potassium channel subfamily K member 10-like n=1 Tax=Tropilaelaps mercedesae TaxID=418985 RepID=A0A1V9XDP6_9ACAR|nr:potassium channel subfamily K member 10-like [Tropilaelaps mercedesae]